MRTSRHIDWLSITINPQRKWENFLPLRTVQLTGVGRHGYRQAWEDIETGARIEAVSDNPQMGTHFTLTGDTLTAMRHEFGMTDDGLIERITQWEGKCSRIDIAVDCWSVVFTPEKLAKAITDGSAKWHARTWRYIDGRKAGIQGSTVDTGSNKSDKRFRCYDKRAEQGIKDGESWIRLELQLRRLYARSTVKECSANGVGQAIAGSIGRYLQWTDEEYLTVLSSDSIEPEAVPRKDGKRKLWLLGQVAKALAIECIADRYFRERFNQAVNGFLDKLTSEAHNDG